VGAAHLVDPVDPVESRWPVTSTAEIGLLRLAAQRLAGPVSAGAAEVVRLLTAAQAQDGGGVLTSVALRTASRDRADVEAALAAGEIVVSWPVRGTLHLVAAEDLPWMLDLTAPRVVAGAAGRRARLGLDETGLERAREAASAALAGGRRLSRDELYAVWGDAGLPTAGPRGYHMLFHLAVTGTLCFGPLRDAERLVVGVDGWIPRPRRLEREAALGELAERYFRGHGPATVADFTRWTRLPAADVRAGLAIARPGLARVESDGVEYFLDPRTPDLLDEHRREACGVFLLPGFDEFVLGYADRRAVLAAEFADRIVPGGNGVFRPTVVGAGRVLGTWRHAGRGAGRTVAAEPFTAFPAEVAREIPRVYAALP
jgi:hypothetical protein